MQSDADYQLELDQCKRDVNRRDAGVMLGMIMFVVGVLLVVYCSNCAGEWYEYQPAGAVDGEGILKDVTSRTHDPQLNKFRNDKATWTHEGTHCINADIRNSLGHGKKALYVGAGQAMVLSEPKITFEQFDRHVKACRNETYRHYLKQARSNDDRLDFLDEWSAYVNDLQCTNEFKLRDDGNYERAHWFSAWANSLVETVREHDPEYPDFDDLTDFVDFQNNRLADLAKGN